MKAVEDHRDRSRPAPPAPHSPTKAAEAGFYHPPPTTTAVS
jgi:hypothetical protein